LVERYQPTLVIIDSITLGSYSSDLKEASETTSLMEFLQQLRVTVLGLDHTPKPAPGTSLAYARPFGSFAKRAKTRHAVLVTPSEAGGVVLRVVKSNLSRAGTMVGVDITWTDDAIRVTAVPLDDDALAGVEHHLPALEQVYRTLCQHEAMTAEELSEATGLAVGTVRNKLTALRHQGRAEPLGDGRWRGVAPATLVVRGGDHRSFTVHSLNNPVNDESEPNGCQPSGDNPQPTLVGGTTPPGDSPFTHSIGRVNSESGPNGHRSPGDSPQPLVAGDNGHQSFTVHSLNNPVNDESGPNGRHSPGDSPQPLAAVDNGDRPFTVHSPYTGVNSESGVTVTGHSPFTHHIRGMNGESDPTDHHSPDSQPTLVEQGAPDDIIEWGEWLLAELRAGGVRLPVVDLRPGHSVVVPERFLASHLAEAKMGIGVAVENLRLYRKALERAGMG
jgi:DNA-binding transcriptional ArsR family regulator